MNLHDRLKKIIDEAEKDSLDVKRFLMEEDDPFADDGGGGDDAGGDPFADDAGGGDDAGGDAGGDPFADDAGGGDDAGGDAGGDDAEGGDAAEGEDGEEKDKAEELDLEGHEDDPEFTNGVTDKDDVTLPDTPAPKTMFDIEKIMDNVAGLVNKLSVEQLAEYDQVKKCVELIFNGKILKEEDLDFNNIQNAIFLIAEIEKGLDIKTIAYLNRKMKEPLILKRDAIKQDMAKQQNDLTKTRDAIIKLDTVKV